MCMKYIWVNVAVVCGYFCESFGDVVRGEEGINVCGICTGYCSCCVRVFG